MVSDIQQFYPSESFISNIPQSGDAFYAKMEMELEGYSVFQNMFLLLLFIRWIWYTRWCSCYNVFLKDTKMKFANEMKEDDVNPTDDIGIRFRIIVE